LELYSAVLQSGYPPSSLSYAERLKRLNLYSLELRRLQADLIYCYKAVFKLTDLQASDFFKTAHLSTTWGHIYKLYKKRCYAAVQSNVLIVNICNNLPGSVDFSS